MPVIALHGHFAVVGSTAAKPQWKYGVKRIALLEVHPELIKTKADMHGCEYISLRIDPRMKAIKKIIVVWEPFYIGTTKGYWMHRRCWEKANVMAAKFDRMYPLHIIARDWPLPLPVYVD